MSPTRRRLIALAVAGLAALAAPAGRAFARVPRLRDYGLNDAPVVRE